MKLFKNAVNSFLILLVFVAVSCEQEQEITVGGEVLPGSERNFEFDTISDVIKLKKIQNNRVQTNNLPFYRLGSYKGKKYELVVKPVKAAEDNVRNFDEQTFARLKSVNLILGYRSEVLQVNTSAEDVKDTLRVLENTTIGEMIGVNVMLLGQEIKSTNFEIAPDPNSVVPPVVYYNDGSSSNTSSNKIDVNLAGDLLANKTVEFPSGGKVLFSRNGNEELSNLLKTSRNIEDAGGAISINLNLEKFSDYFVGADGGVIMSRPELIAKSTSSSFENAFKAIYLQLMEEQNDVLLELLSNADVVSRIQVIFDVVDKDGKDSTLTDKVDGEDVISTSFEVPFLLNNAQGQEIINLINVIDGDMNSENSDLLTIQGGIGGAVASLELFPNDEDFNDFLNKKRIVSEAFLRFVTSDESDLPDRLLLSRLDVPEAIGFSNFNSDGSVSLEKGDNGETFYDIVITNLIQQILNQNSFDASREVNQELLLSLYDGEVSAYLSAISSGDVGNYFIDRNLLFSEENVSIHTSNVEVDALKPKLIIKFTPAN